MSITVTSSPSGGSYMSRTSLFSGQLNRMDLPVSPDKLVRFLQGEIPGLIQNVFPELSADQREFVLTGYTPEDWQRMFPPEEEE